MDPFTAANPVSTTISLASADNVTLPLAVASEVSVPDDGTFTFTDAYDLTSNVPFVVIPFSQDGCM